MKRKISFILAAVMLIAMLPQAISAEYPYPVYSYSYENNEINFVSDSAKMEIVDDGTDGKCLMIGSYEKEEDAPQMVLKNLDRSSRANISMSLKSVSGEADAKIIIYLNEGGREKAYTFAKVTLNDKKWTEISDTLVTKFKTISGASRISVICENDSGFCEVYVDDFTVTSDKESLAAFKSVEKIEDTGKLTIRASFETNTTERFDFNNTGRYEITDEVPAHSGTKSLKITGRKDSSEGLIYLYGISPKATVTFSCWVKNLEGEPSRSYVVQGMLPLREKNYWPTIVERTYATDSGWTKLTGTIKLSDYDLVGVPSIHINASNSGVYFGFYVDDLVITADVDGEFYDDMNYVEETPEETEKKETDTILELSSTAYEESPDADIEDDLPALKDVFKDYFKVGACVWNNKESDTTPYGRLIKKHFNSIVSNGHFHLREIINDAKTRYNFTNVDKLMDFAFRNGITDVVGHALAYDSAAYRPFVLNSDGKPDRDVAIKFLKESITTVMRHCEGDGPADEYGYGMDYSNWHIDAWDTSNEAVAEGTPVNEDGTLNYKKTGALYSALGEEYVDYAFKFADETGYDDVKMRYNDYNLQNPAKAQGVYLMVKGLKDRGHRVDVIGLQSHFDADFVDIVRYRDALDKFLTVVDEIDITEFDCRAILKHEKAAKLDPFKEGITKEREFDQAYVYAELFKLFREYSDNIPRVNFWTIYDGLSHFNGATYQKTEYTGIFDRDYKAKPIYWAIVDPDKFYNEIMIEDTKVPRIRILGRTLGGDDRADSFNENGVIYSEARELLEGLGASVKQVGDEIHFIKGETYGCFTSKSADANIAFENAALENATIERDGKMYLPAEETAKLLGYYTWYVERRNILIINDVDYMKTYTT